MAPSSKSSASSMLLPDRIRRQNHSCDHCRKSKKACDGYMINEGANAPPNNGFPVTVCNNVDGEPLPCSYCVRTKKKCSMNPYWRRPQSQMPDQSAVSDSTPGWERGEEPKRQRTSFGPFSDLTSPESLELTAEELAHVFQVPDLASLSWDLPTSGQDTSHVPHLYAAPAQFLDTDPIPGQEETPDFWPQDFNIGATAETTGHLSQPDFGLFSVASACSISNTSESDSQSTPWSFPQAALATPVSMPSSQGLVCTLNGSRRRRRISEYSEDAVEYQTSISTADNLMMVNSNNFIITDSLLRIYHDVLENNLACWLAEENCPYKMSRFAERSLQHAMSSGRSRSFSLDGHSVPEWGTSWSNRLYRRVTQLDRVAQRTKTIRLTRAESQAASRALDLVIMAFATQYAQGSRRRDKYRSMSAGQDDTNEAFEKTMQQAVWRQARQALSEVAEVESYRVVYAELIFGLTEKPWIEDDFPEAEPDSSDDRLAQLAALPKILEAIAQSGPPVFLDRAARNVQALRFRFETNETASAHLARSQMEDSMAMEDRKTIGLLYWLAVMFDTVSSSMNERPVALADEECEQDVVQEKRASCHRGGSAASRTQSKWEVEIFVPEDPSKSLSGLSWPCAYEVATSAISRSAPIKILIFRHLSYFQNVLRRKEFGQATEDAIRGATLVYRYWNTTYGSFYRDLVQYYDSVPTRIRSWFVCIYIPWHLASIMLSEMIDAVDNNNLGVEQSSRSRLASNMASRMRKSSAVALSDLARVTTPETLDDIAPQQLPGFHFAVEEGPLMTEPWTVILVRAFTKTALFHLGVAEDLRQHDLEVLGQRSEELQDSIRRAEYCSRALWSLGKKSQTARNISNILSGALQEM